MCLCLLLGSLLVVPAVIAAPQNKESTTSSPVSVQTNNSSSLDNTLTTRFPYLQRALIIATIVNFVVIVFALLFYIVKRRMNQFSPVSVMRTRQQD